jgi:hypothetical protein
MVANQINDIWSAAGVEILSMAPTWGQPLAIDIGLNLSLNFILNRQTVSADVLISVAKWSGELEYHVLQEGLVQLAKSKKSVVDGGKEWPVLQRELERLMRSERNLGYTWNMNREEVKAISNYLALVNRIYQCLQGARVSNRQQILDKLLAPPP